MDAIPTSDLKVMRKHAARAAAMLAALSSVELSCTAAARMSLPRVTIDWSVNHGRASTPYDGARTVTGMPSRGLSVGIWRMVMVRPGTSIEPRPRESALYQEIYQRYLALYPALKGVLNGPVPAPLKETAA